MSAPHNITPLRAAIALQGQPCGIEGARIGIDLSSRFPAPCDQFVGLDEHPLDFDALLDEVGDAPLHSRPPHIEGVIDIIENLSGTRVIFRQQPEDLKGLRHVVLSVVSADPTLSEHGTESIAPRPTAKAGVV